MRLAGLGRIVRMMTRVLIIRVVLVRFTRSGRVTCSKIRSHQLRVLIYCVVCRVLASGRGVRMRRTLSIERCHRLGTDSVLRVHGLGLGQHGRVKAGTVTLVLFHLLKSNSIMLIYCSSTHCFLMPLRLVR